MTRHYQGLGSACDWLRIYFNQSKVHLFEIWFRTYEKDNYSGSVSFLLHVCNRPTNNLLIKPTKEQSIPHVQVHDKLTNFGVTSNLLGISGLLLGFDRFYLSLIFVVIRYYEHNFHLLSEKKQC